MAGAANRGVRALGGSERRNQEKARHPLKAVTNGGGSPNKRAGNVASEAPRIEPQRALVNEEAWRHDAAANSGSEA